jgi:NAD(P)H-hydrate epimerase
MKVLSSEQIRAVDAYTIKNQPITSLDLMEQASVACYHAIKNKFKEKLQGEPIHIYCGIGNNGGDGLVLARLLNKDGHQVIVNIIRFSNASSADFKVNIERLKGLNIEINEINMREDLVSATDGFIIDAIFGTGLNRVPRGLASYAISHINKQKVPVVAIDIPSGLFCDKASNLDSDLIIEADYTFVFQVPKLAFFMQENNKFIGNWEIVDIGLDKNFIEQQESNYYFLVSTRIKNIVQKRNKFDHKGRFGHSLIVGGDFDKAGAAILAGKGALRSGAGLVTIMLPKEIAGTVHQAVPELMCWPSGDSFIKSWDKDKLPKPMDRLAIGLGIGIGTRGRTQSFVEDLLKDAFNPLVIDADALNIIAKNPKLLDQIPAQSILTPHAGEFKRLVGEYKNGYDRLNAQIEFSKKHKVIVVLKGAYTRITTPKGIVFFNSTGNPGMGTPGSGDVLTGILTSLLGQYKNPVNVAILGVYLHGLAGDIAVEKESYESLIASDIVKNLGKAFNFIRSC